MVFMKILWTIFGIIMLIPLAAVIVALACVSVIGGYLGWLVSIAWEVILAALAVYIVIKVVKHFTDKG